MSMIFLLRSMCLKASVTIYYIRASVTMYYMRASVTIYYVIIESESESDLKSLSCVRLFVTP